MLLWREAPLLSMQLLWINLVTDSLPAIALGMEPVEGDVMDRKPKPKEEGIFAGRLGWQVLLQGVMFSALTLIGFILGWKSTGNLTAGRTMAFFILALTQVIHSFNMRSNHSLFEISATPMAESRRDHINSADCRGHLCSSGRIGFGLTQLSMGMYLTAVFLAAVPVPVLELLRG